MANQDNLHSWWWTAGPQQPGPFTVQQIEQNLQPAKAAGVAKSNNGGLVSQSGWNYAVLKFLLQKCGLPQSLQAALQAGAQNYGIWRQHMGVGNILISPLAGANQPQPPVPVQPNAGREPDAVAVGAQSVVSLTEFWHEAAAQKSHPPDAQKYAKLGYIVKELWILAWAASVQRAGLYKAGIEHNSKEVRVFREKVVAYLSSQVIPKYSQNGITEERHYEHIDNLIAYANSVNDQVLGQIGYKYGVAQKLLNLALKYHWCLGLTAEPPHCPVDRIVIDRTKYRGHDLPPKSVPVEMLEVPS